jgi:ribosomal protein S18 acetylase RimI-like enzyme
VIARRHVEEGIDLDWLRREGEADPLRHAFAIWDIHEYADRVRFVTLREANEPKGYLLVWYGSPNYPVVHWVGAPEGSRELAEALPERPFVAVVPSTCAPMVEEFRGPTRTQRLRLMEHQRTDPIPQRGIGAPRRLTAEDLAALRALSQASSDVVTSAYASIDPARTYVSGVFATGQLVAVARAQVQLDRVWVIGGIYTRPDDRGRGYGEMVTAAITRAAHAAGADAALYVRVDNVAAVRAYERVGYRLVEEKVWMDAGANILP